MNRIVAGALASIAAVGLLSACGGDDDEKLIDQSQDTSAVVTTPDEVSLPSGVTLPTDLSLPTGVTFPTDLSLPTNLTLPEETVDLIIAQLEANGLKVDRECFTALLSDPAMLELAQNGGGGTPTPELTQKFFGCMSP